MAENKERKLDDINEMLSLAKLNENDILPTSQSLYFTEHNFYDNNYKFLELNQQLFRAIKEGQTLYIKGDDEENVVLCTNDQTYDVTVAETSNSLLLLETVNFFDDLKEKKERNFEKITVCGIFYEYLSLTSGKPHLEKLMELLNKSVYKGPEHEYSINEEDLHTFESLNSKIQASEVELRDVLNKMDVVTVNNKIRLLDVQYHFRVLSYMLQLIDENSWNLDEIDLDETLTALRDLVPEEILINLFDKYTEESKVVDGLQLYAYKESKICRFFAQMLLWDAEKFNLDDFLQAWGQSVPQGMEPSEDLLHGIAIIDRKSTPNTVFAFPEEKLPQEINARFATLFNVKEKWTVPEITPYIQRLATPKLDVNALLAKHARASTVQGVKYYSAKHAK